jgi:hypothetical protein
MIFQCPLCKQSLSLVNKGLNCINDHTFPIINEIIYFLPQHYSAGMTNDAKHKLERSFKETEYKNYIKLKKQRGIIEPYAAFQPFNESFQSLLPYIESLKNSLELGDFILDTWCRTGFTGDFLANTFPEQTVISIWEGNNSVLGFKGFNYYFGGNKKRDNHIIIFHDNNNALPFKDNVFSFIYGYDSLHRYRSFTDESFRVTKINGIINFAHVHLSNSQPEPFFERDGKIDHGLKYQKKLDIMVQTDQRTVAVLSETDAYLSQAPYLHSTPNTGHYNGFIWVATEGIHLRKDYLPRINKYSWVLVNPLFTYKNKQLEINFDFPHTMHIFERHPVLIEQYKYTISSLGALNLSLYFKKNIYKIDTLERVDTEELRLLMKHKVLFIGNFTTAFINAQSMHLNL